MDEKDVKKIEKQAHAYIDGVLSGEIVACRFVRLAATRHLDDLAHGKVRGLYFDRQKAAHACKFFSFLKLWKGKEYKGLEFSLGPHFTFITWVLMGWYRKDGTRRFRKAYLELGRKSAKAEWIENEIPTPDGFKKMADIHPGDYVFGSDGRPIAVTHATDIMEGRDCLAVSFSTGERIIVSSDHLWKVNKRIETENQRKPWTIDESALIKNLYPSGGVNKIKQAIPYRSLFTLQKRAQFLGLKKDNGSHSRSVAKLEVPRLYSMPEVSAVIDTKTIMGTIRYSKREDLRYSIDVAPSIETKEKVLLIPPYTLGAWLGDGGSDSARITIGYEDLAIGERINSDGVLIEERKSNGKNCGLFQLFLESKETTFRGALKIIGVLGNKHIPGSYLRADRSQRLALLQGLMDTDGTVCKKGTCSFTNCRKPLALGLRELLSTLGIKSTMTTRMAKLYGKPIREVHKVAFAPPAGMLVFGLDRKQNRINARAKKTRSDTRMITDIQSVPSVPVKCIKVDSPDGIYLTGRSFIPTHNTTFAAGIASYFFIADGEQGGEIYSAAVTRDQAKLVWTNIQNLTRSSVFAKKITYFTHNLSIAATNSKCEPLSSDAKSLDGLDTHFASLDELHAHPTREVHDLLADSIGARSQPMILIITTAGFNQGGICYETRDYLAQVLRGTVQDDSFFGMIYTLDLKKDWPDLKDKAEEIREGDQAEDDWTNEDLWIKAVPGLCGVTKKGVRYGLDKKGDQIPGYMTKLEDMRDKARVALQMPSAQNNFLTKRLNCWTQQENRWIDLALWDQNNIRPVTEEFLRGRACYGGIDLSAVSDLTVWVMLFPDLDDKDLIDILIRVWCPEARLYDAKNKYREQYQGWAKKGYLTTTEGDAMDYDLVRSRVVEDKDLFNIHSISVDRGFQGYEFSQKLDRDLGGTEKDPKVIACGMGWVSMNGPCQELERLLLLKKLNHGGNPILRWMADNVSVKINPTGGGKSPNKATSQGKIDGIIGVLLGLDRILRNPVPEESIYNNLTADQIRERMAI